MFELGSPAAPSVQDVRAATSALSRAGAGLTDAERIDMLRALEELTCAAAGAQVQVTIDFEASQRREQAAAGVPAERQARGVAAQVALARRESVHRGQRDLHLATRLRDDLPCTREALRAGKITPWKATIVARETECLTTELREKVDACVAGDPEWIEGMGDRELEAECKKLAYRFDPQTFVKRTAQATSDRRVTVRAAPDTMVYVTALLPVVQGVAAYAALKRYADSANAAGDPRGRGQLMADRFVELLTGQATADAVGIEVGVLLSDRTLLGLDDEPGTVRGYGPVPADVARQLLVTAHEQGLAALRRLYACPTTGQVVSRDSQSTKFPNGLADLIHVRDGDRCRMRWCDAPIRDTDHPKGVVEGGQTSFVNSQGLCEAHNIAKEALGWRARPRPGPDGQHTIETVTPTGHSYVSTAPTVRIVRRPISMEIYVEDYQAV